MKFRNIETNMPTSLHQYIPSGSYRAGFAGERVDMNKMNLFALTAFFSSSLAVGAQEVPTQKSLEGCILGKPFRPMPIAPSLARFFRAIRMFTRLYLSMLDCSATPLVPTEPIAWRGVNKSPHLQGCRSSLIGRWTGWLSRTIRI